LRVSSFRNNAQFRHSNADDTSPEETVIRAANEVNGSARKQLVQPRCEEDEVKHVFAWTFRQGGSAKENEEAVRRVLQLFSKWTPPASATIHQFVGRLDGGGGFMVIETDNPADLADGPTKFGPFFDYQLYPVVDIAETARSAQEGVEFRES